jgi:hypothetical protein
VPHTKITANTNAFEVVDNRANSLEGELTLLGHGRKDGGN